MVDPVFNVLFPCTGNSARSIAAESILRQDGDAAAGEACPVWRGQPMTAHWGIEDPAAVQGTDIDKERAFVLAARYLKNRISVFINLPLRSIDHLALGNKLREIGALEGASRP